MVDSLHNLIVALTHRWQGGVVQIPEAQNYYYRSSGLHYGNLDVEAKKKSKIIYHKQQKLSAVHSSAVAVCCRRQHKFVTPQNVLPPLLVPHIIHLAIILL